jgi:DNA-binding transcriptional LysR family regulator
VHVDVRPGFSSNDYATIAHAVRAGTGIAELPAILYEQRAPLVRILPKWTLGDVTLKLLFASDRLLSKAVRAVIDARRNDHSPTRSARSVPERLIRR